MSEPKENGFLLVLANPSPSHEDEFNAWYDTEHVPERLAVPGFLTGMRYVAIEGYPRYLAHYDVDSLAVLEGPEYQAVSGANFGPWTRRVTATARVDRVAGNQIWPGRAVLERAPRLRLIRFDIGIGEVGALVECVEKIAADAATGTRCALMLQSETLERHYVLIASTFCPPDSELLPRFRPLARRIDQHNLYAAYLPI